ncbi:MAG: hypothetical protein V4439_03130 [Patescibacteria group bacterium]
MKFFEGKEKDELALVFDVGSSSVGGALFYMQKSGAPKIIFSTREAIQLDKEVNFDRFLSATEDALGIVANKIIMAKLGAPKNIFCVLSSPWYASQIRTIKLQKNAPFIFTSKLADSLIDKEVNLFEEEYVLGQNHPDGVRRIELKNIKTTLNGYTRTTPLGQKAKELEITIFISIASEKVLKIMEESISRHFNLKNIKFVSFALASFAVVRDMFMYQDNFLLIDVGGEVTDISMVKKDTLCNSISFPMGPNFMIRGVASALNSSLEEARSLFSLYKDNHADENTKLKLEPVISELKKEWLKKFQESLVNFSNDISIPSTIFITADADSADFFAEIIKSEQFNQYTLTETKFKIVFLDSKSLHGIAEYINETERDSFLTIESIYISRFFR